MKGKRIVESRGVRRTQQTELNLRKRQLVRRAVSGEGPEEGHRLVVVANRLPISLCEDPETGKLTGRMSSGGLVSALMGVRNISMIWVGWPGRPVEEEQRPMVDELCREHGCVPVYLSADVVRLYYDGFSNNVLWPAFHYMQIPLDDSAQVEVQQWEAYVEANRQFASVVQGILREGDAVWFHDYHLMLAPQMLRESAPRTQIGWFLHTPFPSSEIFRTLSYRTELLRGVLNADLIGTQTFDYARHFLNACTRLLGLEYTPYGVEVEGHLARVGTFPIGIDPRKFLEAVDAEDVAELYREQCARFGDARLIVGIDRLDMIKGIPQKLLAFERFLHDNPTWRDKVVLVQIAVPSRINVPEYKRLRQHVHELVGRINGRFGTLSHVPIHYLDQSIPFRDMVALLKRADAALITSVRDGMNLVSYEYVVCQRDNHGVLVLSEFAGAAQSLGYGALLVNPWNIGETACAILEALEMSPGERADRHRYMFQYVTTYTCQSWARSFLSDLVDTRLLANMTEDRVPPRFPLAPAASQYASAARRLIVLGYQGTLTPAVLPHKARRRAPAYHTQLMLRALEQLVADPRNVVVVMSSSPRHVLDELFGHLDLYLCAENGVFVRRGPRARDWVCMEQCELSWMDSVHDVFNYFAERTPGAVVSRRETSLVFNLSNVESEFGRLQSRDMLVHMCAGPLSTAPVDIMQGKQSLEVRYMGITRGGMLHKLLVEMFASPRSPLAAGFAPDEVEFVMCTSHSMDRDEDAFTLFHDLANQVPPLQNQSVGSASPSAPSLVSSDAVGAGAGAGAVLAAGGAGGDLSSSDGESAGLRAVGGAASGAEGAGASFGFARAHSERSRTSTLDLEADVELAPSDVEEAAAGLTGDRSLVSSARLVIAADASRAKRSSTDGVGREAAAPGEAGAAAAPEAPEEATGGRSSPAHSTASHGTETLVPSLQRVALPRLHPESTFTCHIGRAQTAARYYMASSDEVLTVLQTMAQMADRPSSPASV